MKKLMIIKSKGKYFLEIHEKYKSKIRLAEFSCDLAMGLFIDLARKGIKVQ